MMKERRAYRIEGRVQGVGFRWWTQDIANGLGLRGRVWNAPDGTVGVDAAGPADSLGKLEDLLREGPPGSRVEEVRSEEPADDSLPDRFVIGR